MESETPTAAKPSCRVRLSFLLWLFVILFIIYPLSIGPVFKFTFASGNESLMNAGILLYYPVLLAAAHVQPLGMFLSWYFKVFGVHTNS
jgi:hypothetical protein